MVGSLPGSCTPAEGHREMLLLERSSDTTWPAV